MRHSIIAALTILILLIGGHVEAKITLTSGQVATLETARQVKVPHGPKGMMVPFTVMLIGLQETHAGAYGCNVEGVVVGDHRLGFGARSYGKWQMRRGTARDLLRKHPELGTFPTDEGLIAALLYNDRFAATMCGYHFVDLFSSTGSWVKAVLAYNTGLRRARKEQDPNKYIEGILLMQHTTLLPYLRGDYEVKR